MTDRIAEMLGVESPLPPPRLHSLDDVGNAKRLAYYFGDDLRYVASAKAWYLWDGRRWVRDTRQAHRLYGMRLSELVIGELDLHLEGIGDIEEREARTKAVRGHARKSRSKVGILAALDLAGSLSPLAATGADFDADPWLLNCWNGLLDLRTGELVPHRRDAMCSRVLGVDYDPTATCPQWDAFVSWAMCGRQHLVSFMQRLAGYAITGHTTEQILAICHGGGANGKSTYFGVLRGVLGEYACVAAPKLLEDTGNEAHAANVADLDGARFVEVSENDRGRAMRESLVKQLTGDDRVKARFMARDWFEFTPQFTLFYGCNHVPVIRSTDHGIWRRLLFVPFDNTIEKKDQDKKATLLGEAPGILAWLVRGCAAWQAGGLDVPEEVRRAGQDVREDQDVIGQFLDEWCVVDDEARVAARDLYQRYQSWAKDNGFGVMNLVNFGNAISDKGFGSKRSNGIWRTGLRLKVSDAEPERWHGWGA